VELTNFNKDFNAVGLLLYTEFLIEYYEYDGPPGRPGPHVPNQAGLNQDW
jgi:hypothetical protein